MGLQIDPVRALLFILAFAYLIYNIAICWIRLEERQLGVTEKFKNAENLLFPSFTMCPMALVNNETIGAAMLSSNSAELWFNSISNNSNKLLGLTHTYVKEGR